MGVEALESFHLHMRLNGRYFGKMAYVEQLDEDTLQVGGTLWPCGQEGVVR